MIHQHQVPVPGFSTTSLVFAEGSDQEYGAQVFGFEHHLQDLM